MQKLLPGENHSSNYTQISKTHLREACESKDKRWRIRALNHVKGFKNRPLCLPKEHTSVNVAKWAQTHSHSSSNVNVADLRSAEPWKHRRALKLKTLDPAEVLEGRWWFHLKEEEFALCFLNDPSAADSGSVRLPISWCLLAFNSSI